MQVLVNYWERSPVHLAQHLDHLVGQGITQISSFVPWHLVEVDLTHKLSKFLQAASERKIQVNLIVTPEVGVHYPNSGLPKDLVPRPETAAQHWKGGVATSLLPPNAFAIPAISAPEFMKRFSSFLGKVDSIIAEAARVDAGVYERVTIVLTGSFWKYYRAPQSSFTEPFGGPAGDYSLAAGTGYRQHLEQFYAQREFSQGGASIAAQWKTRAFEDVNRRYFYQQAEDYFRSRAKASLGKKSAKLRVMPMELLTPEADPSTAYSGILAALVGGKGDVSAYSRLLTEFAARGAGIGDQYIAPFVHWTALGGFQSLSPSEKQFLLIKSLLLMGGRQGGILLDESEWFSLSQGFRNRLESIGRLLASRDLKLPTAALYLSPHLWSGNTTLWNELLDNLSPWVRRVANIDLIFTDRESHLVIVDPSWILTRETCVKLIAWARGGRVVAIPRSPLYTPSARAEFEQFSETVSPLEVDLGIRYRIFATGEGKVVLYDLPEGLVGAGEIHAAWQTFLGALFALSEVQLPCRLAHPPASRLGLGAMASATIESIPLIKKKLGEVGLFVLNRARKTASTEVVFPKRIWVSDLMQSFMNGASAEPVASGRLNLDVPAFGVLPLSAAFLNPTDGLAKEDPIHLYTKHISPGPGDEADRNEQLGLWK